MKCQFLISKNQIIVKDTHPANFYNELNDKTTYRIVDGIDPGASWAKTILITSPDENVYKKFAKGNATFLYMPTWPFEELESCNDLIFKVKPDVLKTKLCSVGRGYPIYAPLRK